MLKDQLKQEQIAALKSGDQVKRSVLAMLLTAVKNKELAKRSQLSNTLSAVEVEAQSQLSDVEVLQVIGTEVKRRRDSIAQFVAASRTDLAEQEQAELNILQAYLPAQLDETAVRAVVAEVIKELGATEASALGAVMKAVLAKLQGQADGALISKLAKELLA
ncbi:MAG: hypothetical protein A3I32_02620 [Candidatus Yanofskybacteria bacterium RIFCSPLOWO2_02_FULL_45_10]|uniref:Glutamyl-tRNA amidotransferase n=1 Tax=Candidatus Yanofskybacteria bacterium RIFCSPLOWO2_02_FULL_45_10 TaxID=1802706 RepID=A0A1F8H7A5_9BACT|nr:MAG: hypothetical protein A3I32_02620 [Candidatus Yanofskybacteria bacterium RIFCSPLOWO2_02_FULL_45_10]